MLLKKETSLARIALVVCTRKRHVLVQAPGSLLPTVRGTMGLGLK